MPHYSISRLLSTLFPLLQADSIPKQKNLSSSSFSKKIKKKNSPDYRLPAVLTSLMTHPRPDRRRSSAQIWLQWAYAPCIHWIRCKVGLLSSCGHVAAGDPLLLLIWLFMDQVATSWPTRPTAASPPQGSAKHSKQACFVLHLSHARFLSHKKKENLPQSLSVT